MGPAVPVKQVLHGIEEEEGDDVGRGNGAGGGGTMCVGVEGGACAWRRISVGGPVAVVCHKIGYLLAISYFQGEVTVGEGEMGGW